MNTYRQTIFQTIVSVAVVGVVLAIVRAAAPIISPILMAFFLAALGRPAFVWLERRGFNRGWAMLGVVVLMALLGAMLLGLTWLYIDRLTSGLGTYRAELLSRFGLTGDLLQPAEGGNQVNIQATLGGGASAFLVSVVLALGGAIGQLVFAFVLAIMLLLEWPRFSRIVQGTGNSQPFIATLPVVANTAVAYFSVRAKINLMTGAAFAIALFVVGVDYALLWGVVTFFLSFVPYIGIVLAAAAPALLGLAETGWWAFWYVVIAVTVINLAVEYVVAPTMTGRRLSLSPTVVFVSFFFWTYLLGPVGMLVSMPITVLFMLVFAGEENTVWLANMLGSTGESEYKPATAPAAPPPEASNYAAPVAAGSESLEVDD